MWCLSFMDELVLQPQHFPMLRFHYLPDFFHVYKWVQFAVDVMTAIKYCRTESTDMRLLIPNVFNVPTTFHLRWFSVHVCSVFGVDCYFSEVLAHIICQLVMFFCVGWFEFCVVLQGSFKQKWKLCQYLFTWGWVNVNSNLHFWPTVPLMCVFPD